MVDARVMEIMIDHRQDLLSTVGPYAQQTNKAYMIIIELICLSQTD
jgi:hypothetical protein